MNENVDFDESLRILQHFFIETNASFLLLKASFEIFKYCVTSIKFCFQELGWLFSKFLTTVHLQNCKTVETHQLTHDRKCLRLKRQSAKWDYLQHSA
jgi:hypothetical protein